MAHLKKSACVLAFVQRLHIGATAFPRLGTLSSATPGVFPQKGLRAGWDMGEGQ